MGISSKRENSTRNQLTKSTKFKSPTENNTNLFLTKYNLPTIQIYKIATGQTDLTDADLEGVEDLLTDAEKEVKQNYYPKK